MQGWRGLWRRRLAGDGVQEKEFWVTVLKNLVQRRYVPALPRRPRDGDSHFAVTAREGANISRVRWAAGASTCDVDRRHLV